MRAQICFEEALKLSKKEFEGAKSRRREKKESKKLSRELQEAPEEAPSHDPSTLSTFYSAKRAGVRVLGHRPSLPLELSALLSDFRSSRSSFGAPVVLFFEFCLIILVCGGVYEGVFKQVDPCLWKLLSDFQGRFYSSRCVSFPDRHSGSKCEFSCRKTTISWPSESSKRGPPQELRNRSMELRGSCGEPSTLVIFVVDVVP